MDKYGLNADQADCRVLGKSLILGAAHCGVRCS